MTAQEIISNGLFNTAVSLMDDEIMEQVHNNFSPCDELTFLEKYMELHKAKYNKEFTI